MLNDAFNDYLLGKAVGNVFGTGATVEDVVMNDRIDMAFVFVETIDQVDSATGSMVDYSVVHFVVNTVDSVHPLLNCVVINESNPTITDCNYSDIISLVFDLSYFTKIKVDY